jgi:xanthine dehydrogenase YagR molybdenum-binding subunit
MSSAIGSPHDRADGPAKVTGAARYTADAAPPGALHAALATSRIACGRLTALDTSAAERAAGVVRVLTHRDMPRFPKLTAPPAGHSLLPMQDDRIRYEGQPIALVVAESLEQAIDAARLVAATYAAEPATVDFRDRLAGGAPLESAPGLEEVKSFVESDTDVGDYRAGLAAGEVRVDTTYRTADRHHNAMEPSATVAWWEGDRLELRDATQWVWGVRMAMASAFGIPHERVHVVNEFLGGGFGCKGWTWPHQILAAAAARIVGRPVKLVLTRAQDYTSHGYQPASEQRVALAATRDGRLTALRHTSVTPTSTFDDFMEFAAVMSRGLYASPAIQTRHRVVRVQRSTPTPMRAPWEGLGAVGLECAMDELACALSIDPVELRLRNHAERDPSDGKPYSSKKLRECYLEGAERFGWSRRSPEPGSMRDGGCRVGWGMATAMMTTFRNAAAARATLEPDGSVLLEAGTQEIGTGVRTIMPQIAAEALGFPVERVRIELGDTSLPETGGTFGSSTTMGVGSAVQDAALKLRAKLAELAGGAAPDGPEAAAQLLRRRGLARVSADGRWSPGPRLLGASDEHAMAVFGAVFAEVRVDELIPIPRVSRLVSVYSAGRIINPKTARSQMIGGMVWGIGQALLEESAMDRELGRFLSKNLSGYLVPANADVPSLEAYFVDEVDRYASPIGARGIGELGAVGVGPAILNAIHHATGRRLREVPVRPELLL